MVVNKNNSLSGLILSIGKYKYLYIFAISCLFLAIICETIGLFVIKNFVDLVLIKNIIANGIIIFAVMFSSLSLLNGSLSFLSGRFNAKTAESITKNIRDTLFDHIQKLSFTYHDNNQTGDLLQRSTSDVDTVRGFYQDQIPGIFRVFFRFSISMAGIIILSWKLALLSLMFIPFIVIISTVFFKKIYKIWDNFQDREANISSLLQENIACIRVVKAYNREEFEIAKFKDICKERFKAGIKLVLANSLYWPSSHVLCCMQVIIAYIVAALMVIAGEITLGTFITYIGLTNQIVWPIQHMGQTIAQFSISFVSYKRITEILCEKQETLNKGICHEEKKLKGEIEFRNVCFEYKDNIQVLKNINFKCRHGNRIALLGESGSGKTSLINLIPRFYQYTKGEIYLDGIELKEYSKHYLRENIGIVEQEPFLFSQSIKDNIKYGVHHDVSDDEVARAAMAACIHDNIIEFADKYDTIIGERGITLSGGQKQRIAIARTLLKNPSILIMDDSMSAVDTETEILIKKALNHLMKDRTTFIIAHKIQSLMDADIILVFRKGEIIEMGTHDELIKHKGFYQTIYNLQLVNEDILNEEVL